MKKGKIVSIKETYIFSDEDGRLLGVSREARDKNGKIVELPKRTKPLTEYERIEQEVCNTAARITNRAIFGKLLGGSRC